MNVSPATKAAAISDYLAGKGGYFQIALEYGIISPYTFKKWVESPEKALNQSSQKGIIELQSSKNECTGLIVRNDLEIKEPEFRTKDAEIKYLRDKIAYLETLSELMGYNPNQVAKKKDSNVFNIFSDQDDVPVSPDSAQLPESLGNAITNISEEEL